MRRGGYAAAAAVGVVVVLFGGLVACGRAGDPGDAAVGGTDFTGRCVGGTLLVSGLSDPVDVIGTTSDPLHVMIRADPAVAPRPGEQVTVVTEALPRPGITAIVTAVGPVAGGGVSVTVSVSPRDNLAQTFVPGVPARVTLQKNVIGKAETISADSLQPLPTRLPGPSTIWLAGPGPGDGPLGGRAHPVAVTVQRVAQGRAEFTTSDPTFPSFGVGMTWPIVVPDHHCEDDSKPGPGGARVWDVQGDAQQGGSSFAVDQGTPLPPVAPPPGSSVPGADEVHQSWQRPVRELDVDDPLDPLEAVGNGGGVTVVPSAPDRLDVTLALRWLGARPVLGEDWVGPYYERFWEGGDTRRSTLGCAPASGPVGHPCAAHYTVAMPPAAILRARTKAAPIDVHGRAQDTYLGTDSGPITLDGVGGYISATSATGDVTGTVAGRPAASFFDAGEITVKTGGRIDLRVTDPLPRSLNATGTGRGPVTIEVPRGSMWQVETDAFPRGRRDIGVPSDPASTHLLAVRGDGGGDVTVRYAP